MGEFVLSARYITTLAVHSRKKRLRNFFKYADKYAYYTALTYIVNYFISHMKNY